MVSVTGPRDSVPTRVHSVLYIVGAGDSVPARVRGDEAHVRGAGPLRAALGPMVHALLQELLLNVKNSDVYIHVVYVLKRERVQKFLLNVIIARFKCTSFRNCNVSFYTWTVVRFGYASSCVNVYGTLNLHIREV